MAKRGPPLQGWAGVARECGATQEGRGYERNHRGTGQRSERRRRGTRQVATYVHAATPITRSIYLMHSTPWNCSRRDARAFSLLADNKEASNRKRAKGEREESSPRRHQQIFECFSSSLLADATPFSSLLRRSRVSVSPSPPIAAASFPSRFFTPSRLPCSRPLILAKDFG